MSSIMDDRRLLELLQGVRVADTREEVEFSCLIQLKPVHINPSSTSLRQVASHFTESGMETVVLAVIVPDTLTWSATKSPKELREGLPDASDLQVQEASRDPGNQVADTAGAAELVDIELFGGDPSFAAQVLVQDQSLLLRRQQGHSSPGLYLSKVGPCRGPNIVAVFC